VGEVSPEQPVGTVNAVAPEINTTFQDLNAELAQSFKLLGVQVTTSEFKTLLDPDVVPALTEPI
jgi:hypothetical protein